MESGDSLQTDLVRLKERLEQLERSQAEEIGSLRYAIAQLEAKLAVEEIDKSAQVVATPPPLPPPVVEEAAAPAAQPVPVVPDIEPAPDELPVVKATPTPAKGEMELQIGRIWLVRIGVVLLVTGLVLLGNYAYQNWIRDLSSGVRLGALYLSAIGIMGAGWRLARGERMEKFGEVLMAGGMAFFYWCTFAGHQVARLRVIDSPVVAGLLLLVAATFIVVVSIRRKTPLTAMMGLLMASYATTLQPVGWLAAVSNVFLSAGGVFLMRRPGWGKVGVIGMVGIYASFFWWNLAGASGGGLDVSGLWFVAASWALFALPGVIGMAGRFEKAFSDRGRAWFVGLNNAACFGLISLQWWMLEFDAYWQVPAVSGLILAALGALSRDRNSGSSTQISQGIGLLTMALLLKLDGYQLAVGLALESVALAAAFWRFRRLPELTFSIIAMVLSVLLVFGEPSTTTLSAGLVALMITLATGLWCWARPRVEMKTDTGKVACAAPIAGLAGASIVAFFGWIIELHPGWQAGLSALIGLGLAATYLLGQGKRWLPPLREASVGFAVAAVVLMPMHLELVESVTFSAVAICAAVAAVLWEKRSGSPGVHPITWLHALTFPLAMSFAILSWNLGSGLSLLLMAGAVPGMVMAFRWVGLRSMVVGSSLLLLLSLLLMLDLGNNQGEYGFLTTVSALAVLGFATYREKPKRVGEKAVHGITRTTAVLAWLWAWFCLFPSEWVEIIPLTTVAIWLAVRRFGFTQRLPEIWLLVLVSVSGFVWELATAKWDQVAVPSTAHGLGFVISLGLICFAPALVGMKQRLLRRGTQGTFAVCTALWCTQALSVQFGWQPVAILWTILGFAYVSVGLWQRMATLRHVGFALLSISLMKLFVVDVWAFETFTRVMAFIALGVALVVLGFFYNRFATVLKRILESEDEDLASAQAND